MENVSPLWPLAVYAVAIVAVVAVLLLLSHVLGERHRERATAEPYESGVAATGTAEVRLNVKFYLVAVFVLIFDLEAAFLYAWAVAVRETGWPGYISVLVFTAILAAALAYLWKLGALDWGKRPTRGRGESRTDNLPRKERMKGGRSG